jgi:hypothetical protein
LIKWPKETKDWAKDAFVPTSYFGYSCLYCLKNSIYFSVPTFDQRLTAFSGFQTKNLFCQFCFVPRNHTFLEECGIVFDFLTPLSYILNLDLNTNFENDDDGTSTKFDLSIRCGENEIRDTFFVSLEILPLQTS